MKAWLYIELLNQLSCIYALLGHSRTSKCKHKHALQLVPSLIHLIEIVLNGWVAMYRELSDAALQDLKALWRTRTVISLLESTKPESIGEKIKERYRSHDVIQSSLAALDTGKWLLVVFWKCVVTSQKASVVRVDQTFNHWSIYHLNHGNSPETFLSQQPSCKQSKELEFKMTTAHLTEAELATLSSKAIAAKDVAYCVSPFTAPQCPSSHQTRVVHLI